MAKKAVETITGLPDDSKLVVQKSTPLMALWRSELTLAEFKILDGYLARIDSHKPEKRRVLFEKGQLEKMLGVSKINHPELEDRLKHLMGSVVKVPDSSLKRGFKLCTLFEEAEAEQDDNGLWQISLECTTKAMKYFFNIENVGYLRYKLRCITSLQSRYSYILFCYLEQNRFRKEWNVEVDELKKLLNCDTDPTYSEFKYFNKQILKRCSAELNTKTECHFEYSTVKKGRSVVAIHFTISTLSEADQVETQITLDQWQASSKEPEELWHEPLSPFKFSEKQLDELFSILTVIPDEKLPQSPACYDNPDLMRYHYMDIKVKEIIRRNSQKPIRSKFAYLKKLMQNDIK